MAKKQKYKDPEFKNVKRFNTRLKSSDMPLFEEWANTPNEMGRLPIHDIGAYDVQGYWKDNVRLGINPNDDRGHGPDKYKKPNHPTFSNESQYSNLLHRGVKWEADGGFSPTRRLKRLYSEEYYNRMFDSEPGSPEHLDKYESGGNIMGNKTDNLKRKLQGGGPVGKIPSNFRTGRRNKPIPGQSTHTDLTFMKRMVDLGYADSIDSLKEMAPEERFSMLPQSSPFTWRQMPKNSRATTNQGRYRIIETARPKQPLMATTYMDLPDEYLKGGWLGDSLANAASGASIGSMFGPWGTGIGAVSGFVSGMFGGDDEESKIVKPAVSKASQVYDTAVVEGGGNLKRLSQRTDYKGASHAEGGIDLPLGETRVEVEGGESRTGDIVHSSKIKVTPEIMKTYAGKVPLKKGDVGRSVADVLRRVDKRFEKRSGDEWNDTARLTAQEPFNIMSEELSKDYESKRVMKHGGRINKAGLGANLLKFATDPGNAPMIGDIAGLASNMIRRPEKVDYEQASYVPTKFTPISTETGINRIRRSYGNTREQLRRLNPRMYRNQLANLGAAEAETIGDYTGQLEGANAEIKNRALLTDSQNVNKVNMFNTQVGMQEAEANAANRGAKRSAVDAHMMNLATNIGRKARDTKLYEMQDKKQDQMVELQKGWQSIYKNPAGASSSFITPEDSDFDPMTPITLDEEEDRFYGANGGSLARKASELLRKRRFNTR